MGSTFKLLCGLVLVVLLSAAADDATAYYRFDAAAGLPSGEYPWDVAVGDINGDAWLDYVVTNYTGSSTGFTVFLGKGGGDFRPPINTYTGVVHAAIALGHFDADGHVDLALANASGGASVYRGNGDGTFDWVADHAVGTFHTGIVADDFDEDGNVDLVLLSRATGMGAIYTLLGDGYDGFAYSTARYAGVDVLAITKGYFNDDPHVDLAVAAEGTPPDGEVTVFLGVGDGSFTPLPEVLSGGAMCGSVAAAYLDDDTHLDLIVTNHDSDTISVMMGVGDGTVEAPVLYAVPRGPYDVVAEDLDGDGAVDVAVVSDAAGVADLTVLFNAGGGTLGSPASYSSGHTPVCVAAGDFTGNLATDLVVANYLSDNVSLHRNLGDGTFMTADYYPAGGATQHGVVTDDFDEDGHADLAVVNTNTSRVTILTGSAAGVFSLPAPMPAGGSEPYGLTCADFDGDGHQDLATANGGSNDISILLGAGDGTFSLFGTETAEDVPYAIISGDYNEDGFVDLAVANAVAGLNDVTIFIGHGDGTFAAGVDYAAKDEPRALAAADFDGDGHDDLAVVNFSAGSDDVTILLGAGDGTFTWYGDFLAGDMPNAISVGDFNEDDLVDVAVTNSFSNDVSVLLGRGDGSFDPDVVYAVGKEPHGIITVDINMDGEQDLVVANGYTDNISILRGAGDGTFVLEHAYVAGLGCTALVAGQFDGNGFPDLAVTNWGWFNLAVFLNLDEVSAVRDEAPVVPVDGGLARCFPNPSNPRTTLEFDVLRPGRVTITIYDVAGRRIRDLLDRAYEAGRFRTSWSGTDGNGKAVASGVYFARIVTEGHSATVRMVVIR